MVQGVNSNLNNYMTQNTGMTQGAVQQTISKSTEAVTDTVESNALVSSAMGIDKNSFLLSIPLIGVIKFINDNLMGGDESKSILKKVANLGDNISKKFNLGKLEEKGKKVSTFIKTNKYTQYFTDDFKAIQRNSLAKYPKMSEKYAKALLETLEKNGFDVTKIQESLKSGKSIVSLTDDIVKAADSFLATNPVKGQKQISGLRNMLKSSSSQMGNTALGNALSKGLLKTKEVMFSTSDFLTKSDYLMDFFSIVFFAGVLIRATKESKDAPKGEKMATFMHVLSQDWAPLLVMQPATNLAYKLGGNKYRGMTLSARNSLEKLIKTTNANKNLTKEGYKIAKMQQKLLLKGVDEKKVAQLATKGLDEATTLFNSLKKQGAKLNIFEKILKKAGTVLDVGLDTIKSPSKLGKVGNKIKGFAGGFGRFILIMFVLQSLLQKPINKLVHKIFGEPKTYLEKEKAKEAAESSQQNAQQQTTSAPTYSSTNLINQYTQQAQINNAQPVQQPMQEQQSVIANQPQASQPIAATSVLTNGRYIPSITVNHVAEDTSAIDAQAEAILRSTDALMARAKKCL